MQQQIVVQTTQPGVAQQIIGTVQGHRGWSTGIFDCFSDIKSCCMAYFCLPCTLCSIASRLGEFSCMPYCVPGALVAMRARLRTLGGIRGSICDDCITISFCGQCAICQMSRELDNMGL